MSIPSRGAVDPDSLAQTLRQVPLFSGVKSGDLHRLARLASVRSFKSSSVVVKQGDTAVALYCLIAGRVRVVHQGPAGEDRRELAQLGPGDFFGEMALLDDFPRSASVECLEDTECALITKWDFQKELRSHPEIALALLRVLSQRIRSLEDQFWT
jgi:CRP-like cAMP-binding protein